VGCLALPLLGRWVVLSLSEDSVLPTRYDVYVSSYVISPTIMIAVA
jgi:hypothetical protein